MIPPLPPEADPSRLTLKVEERHPLAIRWIHWIGFPVLFFMIWSGLMIYWADSATDYTYEHQVYRIGFGSFTLIRLFPPAFYRLFRLDGHFTRGLGLHAMFMWVFAINGIAYVAFLAISGQWRSILPDGQAFRDVLATVRAELSGRPVPHPGRKYNAAQRFAYSASILMGAGTLLTGIAIWKPTSFGPLTTLLGGYQTARWLHFWLTMGFCLFICVHVLQVLRSGWNNLRGMICGAILVRSSNLESAQIVAEPSAGGQSE
jgi:thiosulfate reductase cytochrome b subunit